MKTTKAERDYIFWTSLLADVLRNPVRRRMTSYSVRRSYKLPKGG